MEAREEALKKRHVKIQERWNEHARNLSPLKVGDKVFVQNQLGNYPRKWDRTGTVVEVLQNDQYMVSKDGSRKPTLRNRKFLRRFKTMIEADKVEKISTPFLQSSPIQSKELPIFSPARKDTGGVDQRTPARATVPGMGRRLDFDPSTDFNPIIETADDNIEEVFTDQMEEFQPSPHTTPKPKNRILEELEDWNSPGKLEGSPGKRMVSREMRKRSKPDRL